MELNEGKLHQFLGFFYGPFQLVLSTAWLLN